MTDNPLSAEERPLVVFTPDRAVIDVGKISDKAFRKSLEHDELWWLHAETNRVLPAPFGKLRSLEDHEGWIEAVVEAPKERSEGAIASDYDTPSIGDDTTGPEARNRFGSILHELASLAHERNEKRPEGSYTSYLFEQGASKIRKKLGEEAIELVLATKHEEIVLEAADLIYHLIVMFEAEAIPLEHLFDELSKRRK